MSTSQHQVQQCLEKSSAKYVDSAKSDIMGALREFKDLTADVENFMYPDGKRRNAFRLKGTIPVYYKGSSYNIPISVYLWDTHPYYAPICHVTPTSTMVIKESETVNKQGRVFLPYLNEWRFPGYDLSGLLQVMAMVFQEKCPLFAKGASNISTSSTVSATNTSAYPLPNQPSAYPVSSVAMPQPQPYSNTSSSSSSTPYPTSNISQFPTPNQPYPNPYVNVGSGMGYQPYGVSHTQTPPPIPPPPSTGSISQEHIRASLLSALEDKIKLRLRDKLGTSHAEMASIRETQTELKAGQQKLKQITEELEQQQKQLENFIFIYQDKKTELSRMLGENSGNSGVDLDSAIDASTPLHKQLLLNYSRDLACDDVIYVLGQALKKNELTVSDYLRHVRHVSRQQFIYRATMQKCRKTAGLPI